MINRGKKKLSLKHVTSSLYHSAGYWPWCFTHRLKRDQQIKLIIVSLVINMNNDDILIMHIIIRRCFNCQTNDILMCLKISIQWKRSTQRRISLRKHFTTQIFRCDWEWKTWKLRTSDKIENEIHFRFRFHGPNPNWRNGKRKCTRWSTRVRRCKSEMMWFMVKVNETNSPHAE